MTYSNHYPGAPPACPPMNHYETLGVARDATLEEIKTAYRRASSSAHPDKAGASPEAQAAAHEAQAAANQAWAVLGDAERRAEYDRTGSDRQTDLAANATAILTRMLSDLMDRDSPDILGDMRRNLDRQGAEFSMHLAQLACQRQRIERRKGKVRRKAGAVGDNLVDAVIDAKLAEIERQEGVWKQNQALHAKACELFDVYEADTSAPAAGQTVPTAMLSGAGARHVHRFG